VKLRVVFDSTTVVSALCFAGKLRWLVEHWRSHGCVSLISRITAAEITRVLAYPKFGLSADVRYDLLADYIPFCKTITITEPCSVICRDRRHQPFLDLAQSGRADVLVSGDSDLLVLAGKTAFTIETPEAYRQRVSPSH
jgi:putative PIN family toxin of toxin-antitoxin system